MDPKQRTLRSARSLLIARWLCWLVGAFSGVVPSLSGAAQLAIIIDDIGYNAAAGRRLADMHGDFTLAVLPFTPHGVELAKRAHARGKELILHTPMSNARALPLEDNALRGDMSHADFVRVFSEMLANIPHITGVNNHMGSQLTSEQQPMNWLMDEIARNKLYFIDSRTSTRTLALQTARQHRVPSMKRDVFLDNQRDPLLIETQLHTALTLAKNRGSAIAIGHPYPETLSVLEHLHPLLEEYDVELVRVSQLLARDNSQKTPEGALSSDCPAPPLLLWRKISHNHPLSLSGLFSGSANLVINARIMHANLI